MNAFILTASHYGVVHFGDLDYGAIVLATGKHGYVRKELAKLLGFHESHKGSRFVRFPTDTAPNSLSLLERPSEPILLPSGRQTQFFPTGIIADVATSVMDAAIAGTLHRARQGIVSNCLTIMRVLATTGEVTLIDETTGYQHHRAPGALQGLIFRLLHQSCTSWEHRFHPDYYRTVYRLFGWKYQGHDQSPPCVIGQIALRWVHGPMLSEGLLGEIRSRKDISQKYHQQPSGQGFTHPGPQIHTVTATTRSSTSYPGFKHRYEAAFIGAALQLGLLLDGLEEGA